MRIRAGTNARDGATFNLKCILIRLSCSPQTPEHRSEFDRLRRRLPAKVRGKIVGAFLSFFGRFSSRAISSWGAADSRPTLRGEFFVHVTNHKSGNSTNMSLGQQTTLSAIAARNRLNDGIVFSHGVPQMHGETTGLTYEKICHRKIVHLAIGDGRRLGHRVQPCVKLAVEQRVSLG